MWKVTGFRLSELRTLDTLFNEYIAYRLRGLVLRLPKKSNSWEIASVLGAKGMSAKLCEGSR